MYKHVIALSILSFGMCSFASEIETFYKYKKLEITQNAVLVDGNKNDVESVAVSKDGNYLCWIGKTSNKKWVYPIDAFVKESHEKAEILPQKIKKASALDADN